MGMVQCFNEIAIIEIKENWGTNIENEKATRAGLWYIQETLSFARSKRSCLKDVSIETLILIIFKFFVCYSYLVNEDIA